jgi:hypothetical protein
MTPAALPPEWHSLWEERAAVMEYDGAMPRVLAEALALANILAQMERAREESADERLGSGIPELGATDMDTNH